MASPLLLARGIGRLSLAQALPHSRLACPKENAIGSKIQIMVSTQRMSVRSQAAKLPADKSDWDVSGYYLQINISECRASLKLDPRLTGLAARKRRVALCNELLDTFAPSETRAESRKDQVGPVHQRSHDGETRCGE